MQSKASKHKQPNARPESTRRAHKMNIMGLLVILLLALDAVQAVDVNLTTWRQHRRQKRFLIYEDGGIIKLVTGIAFPVNLDEKHAWRQLICLMNFHYQFPEPTSPIYWWQLWRHRKGRRDHRDHSDLKGPLQLTKEQQRQQNASHAPQVDAAQQFLYELALKYMNQRGQDGKACLQRLICENGQVHEHNGLYAQLLHRLLKPHRSLPKHYLDAYSMGRHGVNCRQAFPTAVHCVLDDYVHVHERGLTQSYV
ncbi:uncharacterized protein LOC6580720 [Drosophila mojavensis]|uniref:uncharacterized protein LOC6580720 n=1 Tax=Drosophila mojavensis TaxID=7230 RepID=UPI001CD106B1|nr:uncharacterized protein LOC6580720 [Drosophila mojavensis]